VTLLSAEKLTVLRPLTLQTVLVLGSQGLSECFIDGRHDGVAHKSSGKWQQGKWLSARDFQLLLLTHEETGPARATFEFSRQNELFSL